MLPLHAERANLFVLEVGVRGLVLLLAAFALAPVLRRSSASVRSLAWRLSLYGLGALPLLMLGMPKLPFSVPVPAARIERTEVRPVTASPTAETPLPAHASPGDGAIPRSSHKPVLPTTESTVPGSLQPNLRVVGPESAPGTLPPPPAFEPATRSLRACFFVLLVPGSFILWILGALILLARSTMGLMALRRLSGHSAAAPGLVIEAMNDAKREMGVRTTVAVRVASREGLPVSPMTWGAFRPALLLPSTVEDWPAGRLRAVLLHELAHIARGDWAAKVVADVVCAIYWPNPLVWIAAGQMRRESEIACDDRVLGCNVRPSDYAAHLLEIVRMRKNAVSLPAGAIAMAEPSLLETRLRAALDPDRSRKPLSRRRRIVFAAAFVLALLPLGAVQFTARAAARGAASSMLLAATPADPAATYQNVAETALPSLLQRSLPVQHVPGARPQEPQMVSHITAPHKTAPLKIAWGPAIRGLQAGIDRTDGGHEQSLGQHVFLRLWIRNTSARTQTLRFVMTEQVGSKPNPFFWNVVVTNNERISISPQISPQVTGTGTRAVIHMLLKPGQQFLLPLPRLVFQLSPPGNSSVAEATAFVSPGKLSVEVAPFLTVAPEDAWMQGLITGKITLEVTQGVPGSTIMAPLTPVKPEVRPIIDTLQDVAWGARADGLQAGIRIAGRKRRFLPGERVPLECYIRNVTDQDIACSYAVKLYSDQLPVVHDTANPGGEMQMKGVRLTGIDPAFLLLLKAHETVVIEHPGFLLGDKPLPLPEPNHVPKGLEQYPYLERPAVGQYTVQQPFAYHIETAEEVKRLADRSHARDRTVIEPFAVTLVRPDGSRYKGEATTIPFYSEHSAVMTGNAAFAIGDNQGTGSGKAAAVERPAVGGIAWGAASGGLQAGLRPPNGRITYPLGATVAMDYIIRNVSQKEISFEHDVSPGVAGVIPEVFGADGKPALIIGEPILHTSEQKRETLRPGAMVVIGQTAMGIAGDGVPWYASRPGNVTIKDTGVKTSNYMDARPGSYRIRHLDSVYTMPDFAKLVLYTGTLPLEVFDPVAWGKEKSGLQAGISLPQGRRRYVRGETIVLDYLVRNVSGFDVPFQYSVWPTYSFSPIAVTGPDGKRSSIMSPGAGIMQRTQLKSVTLKPGETIVVGHPRLKLSGADTGGTEPRLWNGPGRYQLSQNVGELESGVVEFEVVSEETGRANFSIGEFF